MRELPKHAEIWHHFKDNDYRIVTIATHTETHEQMVVYQALYGNYGIYCRPLDMFMSEVDHVKYPDVKQKYRFERKKTEGRIGIYEEGKSHRKSKNNRTGKIGHVGIYTA